MVLTFVDLRSLHNTQSFSEVSHKGSTPVDYHRLVYCPHALCDLMHHCYPLLPRQQAPLVQII